MIIKIKKRINFTFSVLCVLFLLVCLKAFYIQILNKDKLLAYSKSQIFREVEVYPNRGHIYDRNGKPLAINTNTYSIFTIPKNIENKSVYKELSKIVPQLTYKKILSRIKGREKFTWLIRKEPLSKKQIEKIKKLKGIYFDLVPKRIYPNGSLLSQALGFVGVDNSGLSGIEYAFNKKLKGNPTIIKYFRDAKGRPVKFKKNHSGNESTDITLSIDKDIQAFAERELKTAVLNSNARSGGVGVMNAVTGEILALANYPDFDPNNPFKSSGKDRKLAFVTDPFEPGSVFKALTVVSGLENQIILPDTNYYCERGQFRVEDHIISEAESKKSFEWLSVKEIVQYSSNVGTTKIAFELTFPKLKDTLDKFGIGDKTGIELPAESRGIFTKQKNINPLRLSNISFGQGVATTGIQMLKAYSMIANGGYEVNPTILKRDNFDTSSKRIFDDKSIKMITDMLISVVEEGTGGNAMVPLFTIAGKTSTAQRVDSKGGYEGYVPGFIGFPVGVDEPFVIFAYVDDPREGGYYGNQVSAPIFQKIAQYTLLKNKNYSKFARKGKGKEVNIIDKIRVNESAIKKFNKGQIPNFYGLDKKTASKLAKNIGLDIFSKGIGIVTKQSPEPGTKLSESKVVRLEFTPPKYE